MQYEFGMLLLVMEPDLAVLQYADNAILAKPAGKCLLLYITFRCCTNC